MKTNLFLVAAFMLASKIATAQTEKGTQNLGLDVTVANQNLSGTEYNYDNSGIVPTYNKTNQLNIGPTYSYFIANRLDIGADLNYSHFYSDETINYSPQKQTQNSYSGDVFVRKYFMCSAKFGFRAGPYVGYGYNNDSYYYGDAYAPGDLTTSKTQSFYGGVNLALVYYPAKHLGVSALLANAQYAHDKVNNGDWGGNSSNNYSLSLITNGVSVSVFYVF